MVRIVPEVVAVRVPGKEVELLLDGELWRCRAARLAPPLLLLTPLDRALPVSPPLDN